MKDRFKIAVVGGDKRQELLAELLAADGQDSFLIEDTSGLSRIGEADLTVFPLPACREDGTVAEGLSASGLFLHMRHGSVAAGGRIPAELYGMAEMRGVALFDYTKREEFAIANALATAEGAIGLAILETQGTLQGASCLVIGYGRIGKLLARKLALLGARVTVSARRTADLAWIRADGYTAVQTAGITAEITQFDLVFNTVPAPVLGAEALRKLQPTALVVDLASKPGGVDFAAARELGRRVEWALSLPAKTAPRAAAGYVRDSLYQIMEECT